MKESIFKFKSPEVEKVMFVTNDNFDDNKYEGITIGGRTQIQKAEKEPIAKVRLRVKIGDKSEKFPFLIDIVIAGMFSWEEDTNEENIDALLRINAPSLLLSYVRTVIASITSYSKFSTFNIPFINMEDNEAEYIKEDTETSEIQ